MITTDLHPTDEELAAYIDRRLRGEDRARVTEHLAGCDLCYAIFSGTVRFQVEEEREKEAGKVVPFPPDRRQRRRHPWWIPSTIAAALALIGIGVAYYLFWSRPMAVEKLVAPVEGREGVTARLWDHSVFRGPGAGEDGDSLSADSHASVQAGALFVDFQLAAGAGDSAQAKEIWRSVGNAVANTVAGTGEAQTFYDDVAAIEAAIEKEGALRRILKSLPERERRLEKDEVVHPGYFRLGKWVEAGRLAAELEEPRFFKRRANRVFLTSVFEDEKMSLPVEVEKDLVAIRDAWDSKDYADLARSFQGILKHYDFRS